MSLPLWEECAWYVDLEPLVPEVVPKVEEREPEHHPEHLQPFVHIPVWDAPIQITPPPPSNDVMAGGDVEKKNADATPNNDEAPALEKVENTIVSEEETQSAEPANPPEDSVDGPEQPAADSISEGHTEQPIDPLSSVIEPSLVEYGEDTIEIEVEDSYKKQYIFEINKSINKRMYLYLGEIYKIPCNAIVVGQVESLTDRLDGNDVIFTLAGIELEPELAALAPCTTGDSVITQGWQMPCDWIIHSVGPRFDERYLNASDHALFSAYKSALILAAEKGVKDLVIGVVYKHSKKYPRFDAAHVALRTVRKFLNHSIGDVFERVMFCVNTQEDFEIYSALMHAYFPRTQEELDDQANLLPIELGDEWGEVVIPDRVVKVSAGPKPLPSEEMVQYRGSEEVKQGDSKKGSRKLGTRDVKSVGEAPRPMTIAANDDDLQRRRKVLLELANMSRTERMKLRFQAMLRDIDDEELDDIAALNLIMFFGKDYQGRTVVYLSGANLLEAENYDHDRVVMYLMKKMETLRCVPFVLIYGVGTVGEIRYPDTNFIQLVFDLFNCRYKDNMFHFFILHASFSFRMYFWLLLPLETTPFWDSYINIYNFKALSEYMNISELNIPTDLLQYDKANFA